ncbi:MAG: orotidine-5'-phosphate decarboxylase [bacterium]|nr:orotidine-5'-phosphate decarboxylase [bacterium]
MDSPVIIPLDGMDRAEALRTASHLSDLAWGFKVNDQLIQEGAKIVYDLKRLTGARIFADPKLHDIPNTVRNSVRVLRDAGADLITVHASGGIEMMQAAAEEMPDGILAVTVLTSLHDDEENGNNEIRHIYGKSLRQTVREMALDAAGAGVRGIVSSAQELDVLNEEPLKKLLKVTPGIRPEWYQVADDQARTMTPREALEQGADLLVIGRPILRADDPLKALQRTLQECAEVLSARAQPAV